GRQRRLPPPRSFSRRSEAGEGSLPVRARQRRAELPHHRQGSEAGDGGGGSESSARRRTTVLRGEHPRRPARGKPGDLLGQGGGRGSSLERISSPVLANHRSQA